MSVPMTDSVLIWKLSSKSGNLRSQNIYKDNTGYNLFCESNKGYLTYVKTRFGINLGYKGTGDKKIHLRLPDGSERDILTGEPFALGIGGSPSFLMYAERSVGINLEWSQHPVYEWRILDRSGEMGKPIPMSSLVAIANEKVKPAPDFLVHFSRSVGADIGWTTSPQFWDRIYDATLKMAIEAAKKGLERMVRGS